MATYRDAGVDLEAAERVVDGIAAAVTATWNRNTVGGFGGFAAGVSIPAGYTDPVLMMSTDGVGTKAEVARRAGLLDGLGYDLVAMCVDDVAAVGATPLAMTDYIATERIDVDEITTLVRSVAAACAEANVALLGGETAEHPGVMPVGSFDISGAALGVVEQGEQIGGDRVAAGDVIIGLESPNLRSNGFSLIRSAMLDTIDLADELPGTGRSAADILLEPSVLYAPAVVPIVERVSVHGLAHITGGGLPGNVGRILPPSLNAEVVRSSWSPAPVFDAVARMTNADDTTMLTTFNMGIGFVVIVAPGDADLVLQLLAEAGRAATVIGHVVEGSGRLRVVV